MDPRVRGSLQRHGHHQIQSLKVFYPRPYERTVWHFSQVNSDHTKRAVDLIDWESVLTNSDVNEQVSMLQAPVLCQILFLLNQLFAMIQILLG